MDKINVIEITVFNLVKLYLK